MGQGIDVLVVDHHRSKDSAARAGPPRQSARPGRGRRRPRTGLAAPLHGGPRLQAHARAPEAAARARTTRSRPAIKLKRPPGPRGHGHDRRPGAAPRGEPHPGQDTACASSRRPRGRACGRSWRSRGSRPTQMIQPVDISFRLGPRINASGRLADAALSVELLLSEDRRVLARDGPAAGRLQPRAPGHRAQDHRGGRADDRGASTSRTPGSCSSARPGTRASWASWPAACPAQLQPALHRPRQRGRHGQGLGPQRGRGQPGRDPGRLPRGSRRAGAAIPWRSASRCPRSSSRASGAGFAAAVREPRGRGIAEARLGISAWLDARADRRAT